MHFEYDEFVDENLVDQCDQVRNVAKRDWLSSANVSLAHLNGVKAKVYNFGIADPKDLKATNLHGKIHQIPCSDLTDTSTDNPQKTAWGSNSSIPELLRKQSSDLSTGAQRPGSAKYGSRNRPPSGRRARPQSAKDVVPVNDDNSKDIFGIRGEHYDQASRPPKGISHKSGTGWVGPPAGLKYADTSAEAYDTGLSAPCPSPTPPTAPPGCPTQEHNKVALEGRSGTSLLQEQVEDEPEEKTKRVFDLYIGNPYRSVEDSDIYVEDSDEEFSQDAPQDATASPVLLRRPTPETLHLSLPMTDEEGEEEEDEMDTERLLEQAELFTKKLNLKDIIAANKGITFDNNSVDEPTKDCQSTGDFSQLKQTHEGLTQETFTVSNVASPHSPENRPHPPENRPHPPEKLGVKFSEEKNRTVDITPRNIGRKVSDLSSKKKRDLSDGSFVDLIEVKNRIEPVLSTGKVEMSYTKPGFSRPPFAKSKQVTSNLANSDPHGDKSEKIRQQKSHPSIRSATPSAVSKDRPKVARPQSATIPSRNTVPVSNRPRSATNKMTAPIPLVTVAYVEDKASKPPKPEKTAKPDKLVKPETKTNTTSVPEFELQEPTRKPVRRRGQQDVVTMMQQVSMCESGENGRVAKGGNQDDKGDISALIVEDILTNEPELKYDEDSSTVYPTLCKSQPEKNYYELSRQSSMSNINDNNTLTTLKSGSSSNVSVIKTTKTFVFDELKPTELTIKSVVDPQAVPTKEKDKFLMTPATGITEAGPSRPRFRPQSAKKSALHQEDEEGERPGSRIGFVAMTPNKPAGKKTNLHQRPSSAPTSKPSPVSGTDAINQLLKSVEKKKPESIKTKEDSILKDEEDPEKVIDNLLERTKSLKISDTHETVLKKKTRPMSAHVGILTKPSGTTKDVRRIRSAAAGRPDSCKHSHASTGHVKVKKTKSKPRLTEPCFIDTKTSFDDDETEEDLVCKDMEEKLAENGVNIRAETLQRALYPPTGRTKYYRITTDLPKSSSLTLLSHPRVWLPQEYKRFQAADKALTRANEIMYVQKKAEERKAKLAALGQEGLKKLKKKKGKKGGKKLRRSKSFG